MARAREGGHWRRSAGVFGGEVSAYSGCCERDGGIRRRNARGPTGASLRGRSVGRMAGQWRLRRQEGSRSESSEGATELGFPGQRWGRVKVRRRAERVTFRPWKRSGVAGSWWSRSARPDRCAPSVPGCGRSPAPPARRRSARRWFNPNLRSRMAFSISASGLCQGFPVPVGDEAVIGVGGEEGQLGTGRGLHPPDDEPHRRGSSGREVAGFGGSAAPSIQ